ncbi:MAG TPA: response regulator [Candidatus Udaeobacter sp.]|nr:response regulator [Candidatus Udaeobacter sp.]
MANPALISVVDDDESVRESLDGLFRSVGFRVKVFPSAEAFLKLDNLSDIDCLILDVRMPGMDGLELQRRLIASHHKIPIIFITAHESDREVRARALRNGAVDFLGKPLTEDVLLRAVRAAIGQKSEGN